MGIRPIEELREEAQEELDLEREGKIKASIKEILRDIASEQDYIERAQANIKRLQEKLKNFTG